MPKYSFLLYSAYNDVTFSGDPVHIKNIKITKLQYQFINNNQKILAVQLSSPFNSNQYIDGISNYQYTAIFSNLNQSTNLLQYTNNTTEYDILNKYGTYVTTLNISFLIDGVLPGTESISLSNPIFIEILCDDTTFL